MSAMYDGIDVLVPKARAVRCLGCAIGVAGGEHRCAGDAELLPYGGHCQCPRPGCGQRALTPGSTVPT